MHRPSHRRKPLLPGHRKPERTVLSSADKWKIGAMLVAGMAVFFGSGIFYAETKHAQHVESMVARWRMDYHLDEEHIRQLRRLEEQFHGNGNPLWIPAHKPLEIHEHYIEISHLMSPQDGAHFLRDQEGEQPGTAVPPR